MSVTCRPRSAVDALERAPRARPRRHLGVHVVHQLELKRRHEALAVLRRRGPEAGNRPVRVVGQRLDLERSDQRIATARISERLEARVAAGLEAVTAGVDVLADLERATVRGAEVDLPPAAVVAVVVEERHARNRLEVRLHVEVAVHRHQHVGLALADVVTSGRVDDELRDLGLRVRGDQQGREQRHENEQSTHMRPPNWVHS